MNERIKELAEQARYDSRNEKHYLERVHNREITLDEYQEIYDKKFAELIVKECMSMSDELKAQYLSHRKGTMDFDEKNIYAEGEAACDTLKYKMKKHFGVEE